MSINPARDENLSLVYRRRTSFQGRRESCSKPAGGGAAAQSSAYRHTTRASYHNRAARYDSAGPRPTPEAVGSLARFRLVSPLLTTELETGGDQGPSSLTGSNAVASVNSSSSSDCLSRMALASLVWDDAGPTVPYHVYHAEGLPATWLSHWRQQEERLHFRRAVVRATRGRQLDRRRQLLELLAGEPPPTLDANAAFPWEAGEVAGIGVPASAEVAAAAGQHGELLHNSMSKTGDVAKPAADQQEENVQPTALPALGATCSRSLSSSTSRISSGNAFSSLGEQQQQQLGSVPGRPRCVVDHPGSNSGLPTRRRQQRRIEPGWERMSDIEWLYGLPDEADEQREAHIDWLPPEITEGQQQQQEGGRLGPQRLRLQGAGVTVRPLWIAVHQEEGSREARLYESVVPLEEGVLQHLQTPLVPFCTAMGLQFGAGDVSAGGGLEGGAWRNYFVGVVGAVGAVEEEVLWPNQLLHRDRVMFNVRDALDVARFLALPTKHDIESHLGHLRRLAAERGCRPGWCWHMLRQRWGEAALREHGVEVQ
ncbi:hypothetical protein N2152v2_003628 [Parachlorella kessleri]